MNFALRRFSFLLEVGIAATALLLAGSAFATFGPTANGGPPDGSTGVPNQAWVDREYNVALSGATLTVGNTGTVRLQENTGNTQGGAPTGTNLCVQARLTNTTRIECDHMQDGIPLEANKWYTLTLSGGIKTATGMVINTTYLYQFQTTSFSGGASFVPPPIIIGSVPRPGVRLPSNAKIRVYFDVGGSGSTTTMKTSGANSVLSPTNIQIFAAENGQPSNQTNLLACNTVGANPAAPTDCNMSWNSTGSELIITPAKKSPAGTDASTGGTGLTNGNQYVLIVKGMMSGPSNGVRNTNEIGMPMDYFVSFTATGSDTLGPTMKGVYPGSGATSIDRAIYNISVGFSEAVDDGTVNETTLKLYRDNGDGTFSAGTDTQITSVVDFFPDRDEAAISPAAILNSSAKHFIIMTTGIKDIAGNVFDGDRTAAGNQQTVISFTTGSNINGAASDTTKPRIAFANANNFSVSVTFTEPLQFDTSTVNETSSNLPFVVNNVKNWTLQSPAGVPVTMSGKRIDYFPSTLTAEILDLMLPPDQGFLIKVATSTGAVQIKDLAGNAIETTNSGSIARGTVQNAQQSGQLGPGQGGGGEFDFSQMIRVMPRAPLAGATSTYEAEFDVTTSIPLGGTIVLTFPTGFEFIDDGGTSECEDALNVFDNNDLNGPASGTVTIASIACVATARTVTVTTGGAATGVGRIRFLIQGIKNSTVPKDFTTTGYSVDIKTKGTDGSLLQSQTSMPFFLTTPGSQTISGTVFNDNGAGAGDPNDGAKGGDEPGIRDIKVCLGGQNGFSCTQTDTNGAYSFTQLNDGFYNLNIPPIGSGSFIGGPFFKDVSLTGGGNQTGLNFAFRTSDRSITVNVVGIPSNTNLDVFAFNSQSTSAGGHIVRELLWNGQTSRSATVPVADGTWEVGVGPWMPKDPTMGLMGPPDFNFMPPRPQQITVLGAGSYSASFALQTANRTIKGSVTDAGGIAIADAFVLARPTGTGAVNGGVAQTDSTGQFSLKVVNGVYVIDASVPGMPPTSPVEVTVQDNTAASDSNATADVYSQGVLITNDGAGSDNLQLKVAKGDQYISGRVLDESGNPIAYAHVMAQEVDSSGNPNGPFMGAPSDSSGNFTIYVRSGRYKVWAFTPQYGELPSLTVVVSGSNATGQNLQASGGDFGTISGTVRKGGTAVAGAFVNIFGSSGGNGTVSDSSGGYSLKVRAGSNYTIEGFLPGAGPLTPITGVTVTAGQTLLSQDLSMAAAGTIKATLTGSSIITDAFVEARDSNGRGNGTNTNTTSGVYEIAVPAGTYTVRAHSPRLGLIGSQSSITVTAGQTTTVTFAPPATYTVTGTISSSSATCTVGAVVAFADSTNGRVSTTSTTTGGVYSILLPNGTYRLTAGKPSCIDSASTENILVNGANVSGADKSLTAANATVTGRVTRSSTGVTVATMVMAESSDGKFAFAEVDTSAAGGGANYTLNLTAGTWTISARSEGYASSTTSVTLASGGSATANLDLTAISGYTWMDPTTSTMTPSRGGLVRDTNIGSSFQMNVPAGALGSDSDSASISTKQTTAIATETSTMVVPGGKGYEITATAADGQQVSDLSASVTITIPYTEADVTAAGGTEAGLVGAVWENNQWTPLSTTVDTTSDTLTMVTSHFSTFAPGVPSGGGSGGESGGGDSGGGSGGSSGGGGGGRRTLTTQSGKQTTAATLTPAEVAKALHPSSLQTVRGKLAVTLEGKEVVMSDVPADAWYAGYVSVVMQMGIASGYRDAAGNLKGEYGPANNITYAEIAKMALEAAGWTPTDGAQPQHRQAQNHWAAGYIALAEELALSVYEDDRLNINASASRGAVIQTIVETLGLTEADLAPEDAEPASGTGAAALSGSGAGLTGSGSVATGSGSTAGGSGLNGSGTTITATGSLLSASGTVLNTGTGAGVSGSGTIVIEMDGAEPSAEERLAAVTFRDLFPRHENYAAIRLLAALGVISGDTDRDGEPTGTVRPNASINRAEIAKIFTKLAELGFLQR